MKVITTKITRENVEVEIKTPHYRKSTDSLPTYYFYDEVDGIIIIRKFLTLDTYTSISVNRCPGEVVLEGIEIEAAEYIEKYNKAILTL